VLAVEGERVELEVRCSPGTYVRALARDLGQALGTGAHLTALRRTGSGGFGLEQAVAWDDLAERAAASLVPLAALLSELPALTATAEGITFLRHGRDLTAAQAVSGFPNADPPARVRVLDASGALLALAVPRGFGLSVPGVQVEPALHPDVVLLD
jgi:tRNA pseudouridine55 synthase